MANRKDLTGKVLANVQENIVDGGSQNKNVTTLVLGAESLDQVEQDSAQTALQSLHNVIEDTITLITSNEEYKDVEFTAAQVDSAKAIAALAIDPSNAVKAMGSLKAPEAPSDAVVVGAMDLGIEDMVEDAILANESFDGTSVNNAVYFSIAYNLLAARQDAFGELFFPTVAMDPTVSGITVETEYTSLYQSFNRSVDGSADKKKFNKTPIVKAIYDNNIFGVDKNKVVPVKRDENAGVMLTSVSFVDQTAGEDITTSPLLFGKTIGLLGLSQTDALVAKGVMDETDSLDRTINLDRVYFSVNGDNDGDTNTDKVDEMFYAGVSAFPHSNFAYTAQDHDKDLSLSFDTESIILNTSNSKLANGAASGILAQLPADHNIALHVKVHGDGNIAFGDVSVYALVAEVAYVTNAAGDKIAPESADYIAIKAVFDTLKLEGYTLEAWRTNSNLRTRGQVITSDKYTQIYNVPLRSGISVRMPINNANGVDNDSKLTSQIQTAGMRVSLGAVVELLKTADLLNQVTNNGTTNQVELRGVARHHISPYFVEESINLEEYVDSTTSNERSEDIKAALINTIKDYVLVASSESGYDVAHETLRGGVANKIGVIIGTTPRIKQYLCGDSDTISIGAGFEVKIVSTPNKMIGDKIYISFGIFDSDRNSKVNALQFGNCAWAPTITTDVSRTVDGATVRELTNTPRFAHWVNCPILTVLNISGINKVIAKVARHSKNV